MLAFAEAEAIYNDLDKLFLYTNYQMNENLDFYPSLGFVETEQNGGFYGLSIWREVRN